MTQPVLAPDAELDLDRRNAYEAYAMSFHAERDACRSVVWTMLARRYADGDLLQGEEAVRALNLVNKTLSRRAYEAAGALPRWQWLKALRLLPAEPFGGDSLRYQGSYYELALTSGPKRHPAAVGPYL